MHIQTGSWRTGGWRAGGRCASLALAALLAGCQARPPDVPPVVAPAAAPNEPEQHAGAAPPAPVDWAGAGDCLDQLRLLHALAQQARLEAQAPPFAVAPLAAPTGLEWVQAPAVPLLSDLPLQSYDDPAAAAAAAPCVLVVEQPGEVRAAHRVVDFETVASQYQSGVRSEKNPDYDAAQARLRAAERESRRRGPGILRVGDPMLDLVGLLVGGVIATFDQFGEDDDVEDALAALKETPRSRDRPVYTAYDFERSTVRAGKEATIGVALRDVRRGRVWRAEVRQREMRQFAILDGLDPRDRDYEQHRAGALGWQEFEHWRKQPPKTPISALVAALVEGDGMPAEPPASDAELLARDPVDPSEAGEEDPHFGALAAIAPDAGPVEEPTSDPSTPPARAVAWAADAEPERRVLAAGRDARAMSLVRLEAGERRGIGFYVGPRLVVTTIGLGGSSSVIDVTTPGGEAALGLVVHADPYRGLAVVHVPRAGPPVALADGAAAAAGQPVDVLEPIGQGQARLTQAVLRAGAGRAGDAPVLELSAGAAPAAGAPVFLGERVVALVAARAPGREQGVIPIEAVRELLQSDTLAALR